MTKFTVDVRQSAGVKLTGETWGFVSFNRLANELFHAAKEIKQDEQVITFNVDEMGIHYSVATKR